MGHPRRCRTWAACAVRQPSTGTPRVSSSSAVAATSRMDLTPDDTTSGRGAGDLRQVGRDVQGGGEAAVHPAGAAGGHEPDPGQPAHGQRAADRGRAQRALHHAGGQVPGARPCGPTRPRSANRLQLGLGQPGPQHAVHDADRGRARRRPRGPAPRRPAPPRRPARRGSRARPGSSPARPRGRAGAPARPATSPVSPAVLRSSRHRSHLGHRPGRRGQAQADPADQVPRGERVARPGRVHRVAPAAPGTRCRPARTPRAPSFTTRSVPARSVDSPISAASASVPNTISGRSRASSAAEPVRAVAHAAGGRGQVHAEPGHPRGRGQRGPADRLAGQAVGRAGAAGRSRPASRPRGLSAVSSGPTPRSVSMDRLAPSLGQRDHHAGRAVEHRAGAGRRRGGAGRWRPGRPARSVPRAAISRACPPSALIQAATLAAWPPGPDPGARGRVGLLRHRPVRADHDVEVRVAQHAEECHRRQCLRPVRERWAIDHLTRPRPRLR